MRGGLEGYAADKIADFRAGIKSRDRAVVLGAVLSFIPIFPACFFGLILSIINFILIYKDITSRREERLVKISLAIGSINNLLWLYIFIMVGENILAFFGYVFEIIVAPFDFIYSNPVDNLNQQEFSV